MIQSLLMIKDAKFFAEWERRLMASEPPDYSKNFRMVEAMVEEAIALGVWPPKAPLEGIEVDIRVAKALNAKTTD